MGILLVLLTNTRNRKVKKIKANMNHQVETKETRLANNQMTKGSKEGRKAVDQSIK